MRGWAPPAGRFVAVRTLALGMAWLLMVSGCGGPAAEPAAEPPPDTEPVTVEVFFTNEQLGDPCGEVFPVTRTVAADDPIRGTLEALLAGPTATEIDAGYGGWFTAATADALLDVEVTDGTVHVTFTDLRGMIPNASTSCGSSALLAMLDTTLLALDGITATRYALADQTAFSGWLQLADPDAPEPEPPGEATDPERANEPPEESPAPASPRLEESILLRPDGLGIVAFGTPTDEALAGLEELIGSPPPSGGDQADWVEYLGWPDLGLSVGVSLPGWSEYDGVSRFVGWQYFGSSAGPTLTTPEGVTVGTTLAELRVTYGDALVVHLLEPACGGGSWSFVVQRTGTEDLLLTGLFAERPTDDTEVWMLMAGLGVGC
jgi:hypothetical protein